MSEFVKLAAAAALAVGFMVGGAVAPAQAVPLSFSNITNNDPNLDIAGQFSVEVTNETAGGVNKVGFTFTNTAIVDSVIKSVHFNDAGLFVDSSAVLTTSSTGIVNPLPEQKVEYSIDDPAKNFVAFSVSDSANADAPAPHRGVRHISHWLKLVFELGTNTYNDVIAALQPDNHTLLIGLHVISIDGDENFSDKFTVNPIPLPAGLVLFLSGLLGIGVLGRYKAKRREPAAT